MKNLSNTFISRFGQLVSDHHIIDGIGCSKNSVMEAMFYDCQIWQCYFFTALKNEKK